MNRGDKLGTRVLTLDINKEILPNSKRSQMQISFGMIFSIILIIAFISFAVYAIYIFLDLNKGAEVRAFVNDLQNNVKVLWKSDHGSQTVSYNLPNEIKKVCFIDSQYGNLIFLPPESTNVDYQNITNFNITKTIEEAEKSSPSKSERISEYNNEDGLCFANNGKVSMTLVKNYGEAQVYALKP